MTDPFEALGLPRKYQLDPAAVQQAYLRHAAAIHPDLVNNADLDVDLKAAELNEAKRVLEDPEQRADVLLRLIGGPAKESDRTLPAGFLQEMMERGEQVEEARSSRDSAKLSELLAWAADERRTREAAVAELFSRIERGEQTAIKRVREELNAWRYIERLVQQLHGERPG